MFETLASLTAFCGIACAAYGVGRPLLRLFKVGQEDSLSRTVWSLSLGLVAVGLLLTGLGLVGALNGPAIGVLTMAAAFVGIGQIMRDRRDAGNDAVIPAGPEEPAHAGSLATVHPWALRGLLSMCILAAGGSLISALAPPTAGDALCYHLELPKVFLREGGIVQLPDHDNSTFPLLTEMWFAWALAIEGPVTAQLVHWGLGLLFCLAGIALARPLLGSTSSWAIGAVLLLTPSVTNQMTAPLNDIALATFTTLSLAACIRPLLFGESPRWFAIAGLMLGAALGIKYVAIPFALSAAVVWAWRIAREPYCRRQLLLGAATVAAIAAVTASPWYVRAAWHRGNPVYPFFERQLGGDAHEALPRRKTPLQPTLSALLTSAWQMTMQPDRFGGRGHQFGPLYLAVIPGLFAARRLRGLGTLLCVAAVFVLFWYGLRQNLRFLLPAAPILAVAAIWVWIELARFPRAPRWIAICTLTGLAAFGMLVPLKRARNSIAVAIGFESRHEYLMRNEPTYRATRFANQLFQPGDHLLSQDYRAFYFDGAVTREAMFRRRTRYDQATIPPAKFGRELRQAGFSHLLLAESVNQGGIRYNPTLSRLSDAVLLAEASAPKAEKTLVPLAEYRFADQDGAVRRYRLLKLR